MASGPGMQPAHVRRAAAADAAALARLQVAAQRDVGDRLLPAGALHGLTEAAVMPSWQQVLSAGEELVLSAVDEDGAVCGGLALGPAGDDDLAGAGVHEIALLLVEPDRRGRGHGSRLLAAAADHARAAGGSGLCMWVLAGDGVLVRFLRAAGWAPDGSRRELDAGGPVTEIRLQSALAEV